MQLAFEKTGVCNFFQSYYGVRNFGCSKVQSQCQSLEGASNSIAGAG
jgi:hypothetical protein